MITAILSTGGAAVLVTAVIKGMSGTMRGLVCWTFGAISAAAATVVFYACGGGVIADFGAVLSGLCGAAIIAAAVLAIELFAPAKRLRTKEKTDYDREAAENALNIVMAILAASAAAAAVITETLGSGEYSVFGLLPAAAVSIRQLSYFMYRVKLDTLRADDTSAKRSMLLKRLSVGKRRL